MFITIAAAASPAPAFDWTAAGVVVALLLGLVNTWFAIIRPWRRERHARVEVRIEDYPSPANLSVPTRDHRVVIVNHGPADAHDVDIEGFAAGDGSDLHLIGELPIPRLVPGQAFHLQFLMAWGQSWPHRVPLQWRDGAGHHSEDRWVSIVVIT